MACILLIIIIISYLFTLRQKKDDHNSSYIPNPKGHWINKGTAFDERWEWWEPSNNQKMLYVSVRENDDENVYSIVIDDQPPKIGIEYVNCNGQREADIAVSLYTAYYNVLGSVLFTDLIRINLNNNMNGGLK